ncbi:COG4705 family protein [Streptomyces decoyicus]
MPEPEVLTDMDVAGTDRYVMRKLPEVTLAFWVMKIAATTLGETVGDLFAQTLKLGYFLTTIALFLIFVVTLVVQLRSRRYNPFFYWTVILSTSMAGTTMSDFMNRDASAKFLTDGATSLGWGPQGLGLGYPTGAAILISLLLAIFAIWKRTGLTFAIRDIVSFRAEALFWAAILVSNTLGTSMGDFLSDSSGLGYAGGALLVTGALAVLVVLMRGRAERGSVLDRLRAHPAPWGDRRRLPHQAGRQGRPRPRHGGLVGGAPRGPDRSHGLRPHSGAQDSRPQGQVPHGRLLSGAA